MAVLIYYPLILIIIYSFIKFLKSYHLLQQNLYNENNRYLKYIVKNTFKLNKWYDYLFIFLIIPIFIDLMFLNTIALYYLMIICIYLFEKKKEQVKKPLVVTKRIKRLIITTSVVMAIILYLTYEYVYLLYIVFCLICLLSNYFIFIVHLINVPIEKLIYYKFYRQAKNKLKSIPDLKIIGVTGSYGKTSCKNIVNDILSDSYNTLPSPKSINTFNGLMIVINNQLDKLDNVFIAELGAYVVGEIKRLCKLVSPNVGIITNIGKAHLETFKSQENIQKGKFELIESLPKGGLAILNKDDKFQRDYNIKNDVNVVWIGIDKKADFTAENICQSDKGMTFEVHFKKENQTAKFNTKLLGYNNIYNILSGIALGYTLGISINSLVSSVSKVRPVEHRLELKDYKHIKIIDDAYNSNPVGSKMAVDVLNLMPGKKIIVTPGMIELGHEQDKINFEFGVHLSKVCDEVILVGQKQTKPIYEGLISEKYDESKIKIFNDVKEVFPYVEKNDSNTFVLLENDLPDIFNEGGK